jgi:predicted permease
MVALRPRSLDDIHAARIDLTTLGVAIGAAIAAAAMFALIGVLQASRHGPHDSLKTGSLNAAGARGQGRGRAALVISEMALSAMLLVGATLLVRSVIKLTSATLGFDPKGLYAVPLQLTSGAFESPASRVSFNEDFLERVRAMPQVSAVTLANVQPGGRWFSIGRLEVDGEPPPPDGATSFIDVNAVKPNYFNTMGIALREGATFTDTTASSHQVIVNDGFARKHWPAGAAVGRRVRIAQSDSTPWMTIVGVANDAKTSGAKMESTAPMFYTPNTNRGAGPVFLIRTKAGAASLASLPMIAQQMGARRNATIRSVETTMASSIAGTRFVMTLLTIFTALALMLAGVGLYGVMSYGVAQRTREIGIRMALGASRQRVARRVIVSGAWLAAVGALVGLVAAAYATRMIQSQLYGIERLDPVSFIVGAVVLLGAALLACIIPTRRAVAVDPMTAIRAD